MAAATMQLELHERGIHAGRTPVIDLMQDAFYSRAKAVEPRRCTGCRHAAEASRLTLPTGHGEAGKALL